MKPWVFIPVAAAGVGLFALGSLWHQERPPRDNADDRAPSNESAIADDLGALKEKVARLEGRSEAPRGGVAAPLEAPEAQARDEPEVAPVAPSASPEEKLRATVRGLDERLSREPVDVPWSRGAVRQIGEAIASSSTGARVLAADCASSLCRVIVEHETEEAQRDLGFALAEVEPFRAGVFYDYDEEAVPPVTTLYVIREGQSFREEPREP